MLTIGPKNWTLYPKSPKSLKSQWEIHIPNLSDPIEVIEIEDKFLASFGAHSPHLNHLFGTIQKPSYSVITLIECCLAFQFDSPCAIIRPRFPREATNILRGVKRLTKKFNAFHEDFYDPFNGIEEQVDAASNNGIDNSMRCLERINSRNVSWKLSLPHSVKMKNALHSYRMALLSIDPFSRILNYWRALEPITTLAERRCMFEELPSIRLKPVFVSHWRDHHNQFDVMVDYFSEAKLHYQSLLKQDLSADGICDHFYEQRRCPVAHGKSDPLGYDSGVSLGELHRDSIFLKVIARHAIEASLS
jgi:hypothetical protein